MTKGLLDDETAPTGSGREAGLGKTGGNLAKHNRRRGQIEEQVSCGMVALCERLDALA